MRLDYRAAIITGASSGLGAELARRLADAGVAVGLTARREPHLDELARAIRRRGGTAAVVPADAADPLATRAAIERLAAELGPIDLLIANAGVSLRDPERLFSAVVIDQIIRVNLLGAVHAIGAVLPGMLQRGRGHLVGVSSLAGYRGVPGAAGYSASKAAMSCLLESLRVDLRGRGIAVTTVHPGFVRTEMTANSDNAQPWLLDAEPAARIMLRGIAARRSEVNFPWRMAMLMTAIRRLPNGVYDRLAARLARGGSASVRAHLGRAADDDLPHLADDAGRDADERRGG